MPNQQDITLDNEKKLISFIITVHNIPIDMLIQCIESILSLHMVANEWEIIIIDDGSNPSPKKAIEAYLHNIIYVRTLHQGVSEARNTGIQLATGHYIQFIDGDDYLITSGYSHCIELMQRTNADLILFDHSTKHNNQAQFRDKEEERGCAYMLKHNIQGAVWGYAFRRDILNGLRFTKGVRYGEDEEFTPQLILQAGKTVKTTAVAYFYRQHASSVLYLSKAQELLNDNLNVILRLKQLCQGKTGIEAEALERRVAQLTMDYLYNAFTRLHSRHQIESRIDLLISKGLFPLPDRKYTQKYKWFQRITSKRLGRRIIFKLLPKKS